MSLARVAAVMPVPAAGDRRAALLEALPLFADLPGAKIERLAHDAVSVRARKGEFLFRMGEACGGIHVLHKGSMQLQLPEGDDPLNPAHKLLGLVKPGNSVGEVSVFMNIAHTASCRAMEDSYLLYLPRESVRSAVDGQPDLQRRLQETISRQLRSIVDDISHSTQLSAESRIASYLLELCEDSGTMVVRLAESKRTIASRLSVAPETLSRTLRALKEGGMIRVSGYTIEVLDPERLRQAASS